MFTSNVIIQMDPNGLTDENFGMFMLWEGKIELKLSASNPQ